MAEPQASPYAGFWVRTLGVLLLVATFGALGYEALTRDATPPVVMDS